LAVDGIDGGSCEFLFLLSSCCFVGYELVAIFMSGSVQFGVVFLTDELCVVWSD
jgi:hypothetical protein